MKIVLFLLVSLFLISCQENQKIKTFIYKKGIIVKEYNGFFYSTKYGGLNYYVSNKNFRNELFEIQNIDSIVLNMDDKNYISKPIIDNPYSRVINESDFSFFINEKEHKIIIDTVNCMNTILFFSAKTDMEKLKEKKIINFIFIDE